MADYANVLIVDCETQVDALRKLTEDEVITRRIEAAAAVALIEENERKATIVAGADENFKSTIPDWYSWSPQQMEAYINDSVKDLATAKRAMAKMAFAIGALADRAFQDRR